MTTKTQTAHTPGPWRLVEDAQGPCMIMHPTLKGVAIASLGDAFRPANGFHDHGGNWPQERNANALIMRAAPELVALAEHILAMAGDDYLEGHPEWWAIFDEANAAIAKAAAKGE